MVGISSSSAAAEGQRRREIGDRVPTQDEPGQRRRQRRTRVLVRVDIGVVGAVEHRGTEHDARRWRGESFYAERVDVRQHRRARAVVDPRPTEVHRGPTDIDGVGASADPLTSFEDDHIHTTQLQRAGGSQAGDARTDDHHSSDGPVDRIRNRTRAVIGLQQWCRGTLTIVRLVDDHRATRSAPADAGGAAP